MVPMSPLPLLIASVFLNGVNIDGLRSQSFEKCRLVRVDERGDVHLDCPAYQVEQAPSATPPPAAPPSTPLAAAGVVPASMSKHYWLVTEQKEPGAAQYDIDVFINAKWIRKLKSGEDQIVMDISKHLQPGPNKLIFAATKKIEGGRKSASPSAYLKVIIGEGEAGGNNVMIDNPLFEVKRTAAEMENVNEEHTVNAR
jgi:hypothetical protein